MTHNAAKTFNILIISLNVLYNYLDSPKLFLGLYLAKLLNTLAKLFFPCMKQTVIFVP